jgi:uncharacterized SAM-binding protein YcdF (DUF218 family)
MMEMSPFFFGVYKLIKYLLYPLTWVCLLLIALFLIARAPIEPRRLGLIKGLVLASLLTILVFSSKVVATLLVANVEAASPAFTAALDKQFDAIVVLGAGAAPQGTLRPADELSSITMVRALCGVDLFQKGVASRLVFTGGDGSIFGHGVEESVVMKRLAVRLGVPEEAVLIENHSRTTYENAVGTRRILGEASIVLVTSAVHVPRAAGLFRKQGMQVTSYPCGYQAQDHPSLSWEWDLFDFLPDVHALTQNTETLSEIIGIVLYKATGKI